MVRYPSILHDPTCFHLQTLKKISKTATVAVLSWSKWWPMKPMERPKTKRPLRHPKLIKSSAFAGNDKRRKSVSSILHCVTMYHQLANRMKKTTKVITWRHYAWVSLTPCLFSWESSTGSKHVRKASLVQLIWQDSPFRVCDSINTTEEIVNWKVSARIRFTSVWAADCNAPIHVEDEIGSLPQCANLYPTFEAFPLNWLRQNIVSGRNFVVICSTASAKSCKKMSV